MYSNYDRYINGSDNDLICKPEYLDNNDNCISPYYESNINNIEQAFGYYSGNYCSNDGEGYTCEITAGGGFKVKVGYNIISVENFVESWGCYIDYENGSWCMPFG